MGVIERGCRHRRDGSTRLGPRRHGGACLQRLDRRHSRVNDGSTHCSAGRQRQIKVEQGVLHLYYHNTVVSFDRSDSAAVLPPPPLQQIHS